MNWLLDFLRIRIPNGQYVVFTDGHHKLRGRVIGYMPISEVYVIDCGTGYHHYRHHSHVRRTKAP